MLTAPPSNADQAIAMLLADPLFAPLIAAHRELEPRPPRHAPWPKGVDPDGSSTRCAGAGSRRSTPTRRRPSRPHPRRAQRRASSRRPPRARRSATTCRSSTPSRRDPAARALYLFPTKALAADQLVELRALAERGRHRPEDPHLRRGYAGQRPQRGARGGPGRDHQPGHAPLGDPSAPHQVVQALREPAVRRHRRAAHLPRALRQPRRQRHPPPAARSARHYGADPVFICASATIANPRELAERLLEAPVELIDDNGAPRGAEAHPRRQPAGRQRAARHPRARRC